MSKQGMLVHLISPSGALIEPSKLDNAIIQLRTLGYHPVEASHARARSERFAGGTAQRLADLQAAVHSPDAALIMATRGGYGVSRLLHEADLRNLAEALNTQGHVLCGHSDITSLQLALLANGAAPKSLLHGPMACFDFGSAGCPSPDTHGHFERAVHHGEVNVAWQAQIAGGQALAHGPFFEGPVWGGNLSVLCSLLGTAFMPGIDQGILILEDVNEPVYKIERMLLQLHHAGILSKQQLVIFGQFNEPAPSEHDQGYDLMACARYLQDQIRRPVVLNFPFGHCSPKACWYQGLNGQVDLRQPAAATLTQHIA